jgi:AcrR family transcriptional regulator
MPTLWTDTIESHREAVRTAVMDTTAALVAEHGLRAVTMSRIAGESGIGRATLYKYFPDVESILRAWHERQIGAHLAGLEAAARGEEDPMLRLKAVLRTLGEIAHGGHGPHDAEISAVLHGDEQMAHARRTVQRLLTDVLVHAVEAGQIRTDVPAPELAAFCMNALMAVSGPGSRAANQRLVGVVMDGLKPQPARSS